MPQDPSDSPGLRRRREELAATQSRIGERMMRAPGATPNAVDRADLRRAGNALERQKGEQRRRLARDVGQQLAQPKDPTPGYEDLNELAAHDDREILRRENGERMAREQYSADSLRAARHKKRGQ